eukprot:scaffold408_cov388-Prasinococcus_capsulatus_cf.AAC.5
MTRPGAVRSMNVYRFVGLALTFSPFRRFQYAPRGASLAPAGGCAGRARGGQWLPQGVEGSAVQGHWASRPGPRALKRLASSAVPVAVVAVHMPPLRCQGEMRGSGGAAIRAVSYREP